MEFALGQFIKAIIFPPGVFVILIIVSLWLLKHNVLAARRLLIATAVSLYLLSLPLVAEILMTPLEPYPALTARAIKDSPAKAIVVISAGRFDQQAEYDNTDISGDNSFGRLRYAALLHKKSTLPILISGGLADNNSEALGVILARDLADNFSIRAKWQETNSRNTAENAQFSYQILKKEGIKDIFLVSDAWHMRRAVAIFEKQGFNVTAAPTRFQGLNKNSLELELAHILPSSRTLVKSYFALHEMIGFLWYKLRY